MNDEKKPLLHHDIHTGVNYNTNEISLMPPVTETASIHASPTPTQTKMSSSILGTFLCAMSGVCLLASNTCVKLAANDVENVSSWQMLFIRYSVMLIILAPIQCFKRIPICGPRNRTVRFKLAASAVMANICVFCYYEGMIRLPLGDFGAIAFSSPVFTMFMSVFLLKERCGIYRITISLLLTAGIILISKPTTLFGYEENLNSNSTTADFLPNQNSNGTATEELVKKSSDIPGILAAVGGSIFSAWTTIIVKQISHLHFSLLMFWGSLIGAVTSPIAMLILNYSQRDILFYTWNLTTWAYGIGQSVLAFCGVVLLLMALQYISPTQNKVIRSFQVVGSYILQIVLFGVKPNPTDYIGAGLIMWAVLLGATETFAINQLRKRIPFI